LCEQAIAGAPDDIDAQSMLGRIAMSQYRWEEAMVLFDRVLRVRADPWTLANLGNCHWKTGDLDQAEYCLRGALELEPALEVARVSLATVLHARQLFEQSLKELDIAAGSGNGGYLVNSRRGCTLARLEKYDEAQAAFELSAKEA
jgi:tetratricopeptide (TPR) repeat protein